MCGWATSTNNAPPVEELRVGTDRATNWRNEAEGNTFRSATFSRLYKTEDPLAPPLKLRHHDLLQLALLAQGTHRALAERNPAADIPAAG